MKLGKLCPGRKEKTCRFVLCINLKPEWEKQWTASFSRVILNVGCQRGNIKLFQSHTCKFCSTAKNKHEWPFATTRMSLADVRLRDLSKPKGCAPMGGQGIDPVFPRKQFIQIPCKLMDTLFKSARGGTVPRKLRTKTLLMPAGMYLNTPLVNRVAVS